MDLETRGWPYYKAYLADGLDGTWHPPAATFRKPFAGPINVKVSGPHWTDSISHGELLRAGYDEQLVLDPAGIAIFVPGSNRSHKVRGKKYGDIARRLGILEAVQQP